VSAPGQPLQALQDLYPSTLDCVHCGLCLSSCPTYLATGRETSSPRGRIYLMRGVAEGRLPLAAVEKEAALCLGCRACETACPSGVPYGRLLEGTRAVLREAGLRRGAAARLESLALRQIVARPGRLRWLVRGLAGVQRLGLDRLLRPLLPVRLRRAHQLLPPIPPPAERRRLPETIPAEGRRRGRVALLEGCVMPELFGRVNAATARVLARNGFEVWVPPGQGCCGALQVHAGLAREARRLGRRNLAVFAAQDVDALVVNSAGCGAALRELGGWLPEAASLAARVRDVCEWLDETGWVAPLHELRAGPLRVCYDDPCHLLHAQGVARAPRKLLAAVPGLALVEHDDPGACCGAAGTYNLTQPAMSEQVLERKLDSLAAVDPDVVATGNPGCLMQLAAGVRSRGLRARVVHPVTLLDEASAQPRPYL